MQDISLKGQVFFRGQELTRFNDSALTQYRRGHVGFVFQFYNLILTLTARENVALVTQIGRDLSAAEVERLAATRDVTAEQYKRAKVLAARGTVSQSALDRARMEARTQEAALQTAQAALKVREYELQTARAALLDPAAPPAIRRSTPAAQAANAVELGEGVCRREGGEGCAEKSDCILTVVMFNNEFRPVVKFIKGDNLRAMQVSPE